MNRIYIYSIYIYIYGSVYVYMSKIRFIDRIDRFRREYIRYRYRGFSNIENCSVILVNRCEIHYSAASGSMYLSEIALLQDFQRFVDRIDNC